ncbi:MAG TPA: hypothetical protein VFU21_13850 [Kofleriaceae bacterium]|nr:hypothetical protein [Kofleriaceae bacterium]
MQAWSEAGRRAAARHAWHCTHQGTPPRDATRAVVAARAGRGKRDAACNRTRFLCEQIHRGAHATDEEKAECAEYEAVHGRVMAAE